MDKPVRIMPCLDMQNGRVVKGVQFVDIRDAGNPVECAAAYCTAGADELAVGYHRHRRGAFDPAGGGASGRRGGDGALYGWRGHPRCRLGRGGSQGRCRQNLHQQRRLRRPEVIAEMVKAFGPERVTVAIDVDRNPAMPSGYEVYIDGGRTATGKDAVEWAKQVADYGVQVILPTSKAGDGAKTGYDLPIIKAIKAATGVEVVASGGAGTLEHFMMCAGERDDFAGRFGVSLQNN